ncbi:MULTISPECIES: ThuA domain-containing protein [unclassified Saccharothrix]|uniref:ThuA domain-containing protein n=1 Tax=unclassified Saccharothrix TaxID=2593673 RepID=UPI00307D6C82
MTEPYNVLVFSKTTGYRHDSIPAGVQAIRLLGAACGFTVAVTEDSGRFTPDSLARYEVVVFLNTTGEVLDAEQKSAFESYIRAGGGFVGIHSAADTEYDWPFYAELVGAHFASHPEVQRATVRVEDHAHPATAHLPSTWVLTDEWYDYRTNPRDTVQVLSTVDESTYSGGMMGSDHPHTWCKTVGEGRSFYTGSGHTAEIFADPDFRSLLLGGIRYAANRTPANR